MISILYCVVWMCERNINLEAITYNFYSKLTLPSTTSMNNYPDYSLPNNQNFNNGGYYGQPSNNTYNQGASNPNANIIQQTGSLARGGGHINAGPHDYNNNMRAF